jgi:hypothetical protein
VRYPRRYHEAPLVSETAAAMKRLMQKLLALPAASMREAVLAEQLCTRSPEDAATLAGEIVRRAPTGKPYDIALLALSGLLDAGRLGYDERAQIYAVARERDDILLVRLLLSPHEIPPGKPHAAEMPGRPNITLGERKSLARTHDRQILDRVLRDPDPSVLKILLGNPHVTEADVVRVAARRPTTPEAQRVVFRAARFRPRYDVRRALVLNPYTPSDLAAQLVSLLTEPDLRRVERDAQLGEPVRASARAQLALLFPNGATQRARGDDGDS